jgi:hypothetical protein
VARPRTARTPDGRALALRFEPLGSTWHVSVDSGPESAGLDLPDAVALATGDDPESTWIVELERRLDPEYADVRAELRRRRAQAG